MRAARSASLQSDINVTPLVDVCLVLLIIFMVVLPTMVNGIPVQLPAASIHTPIETRVFPITVKDDGTVYLDTLIVRKEEVPAALERLRGTNASRPIVVRGDKRVAYGEVATVLGACRKAGWEDVKLATVVESE
jgi:biopolymer transport protein ExbD